MKLFCSQRSILLCVAILAIAVIFNSCRKDLLVQSPDNLKSSLSIAEAKSYFNSHIATKKGKNAKTVFSNETTLEEIISNKQPLWDQAYQKMITTGQAVKIPIDFGDKAYALIDKGKNEAVPMESLNYLFMYKDSLQKVHAEWVVLLPDSEWLYGSRNAYSGRILIRGWNGETIRNYYYRRQTKSIAGGLNSLNAESTPENQTSPICILVPNGNCPRIGDCSEDCDMCLSTCAKQFCGWIPQCDIECEMEDKGGGDGGYTPYPSGAGGGRPSSPGKGDYPPNECDSDGLGALKERFMNEKTMAVRPPCVPKPFVLESIANNIVWTVEETQFLTNHPDIATAINKYLSDNLNSQEAKDFAKWAVGYLFANPNAWTAFIDVFFNGPKDLLFENVTTTNIVSPLYTQADYNLSGITAYFTASEFESIVNNLSNDFNEQPIQLYLIACYKNSKLLNSSLYSTPNSLKIGDYTVTPHYNAKGTLVFYSAWRSASLGIEYLINASALDDFKNNHTFYRACANLFYVNGKPSNSQIQMGAGDYWKGLLTSYQEAFSNPYYYVYLAHAFIGTATNLKTVPNTNQPIKFTSSTIRNTKEVSVTIENMSITEYRNAIGQKYNTIWQSLGDGKFKLEVGQNRYMSYPSATSTGKPTIEYFRNGNSIGKFRFHN